MIVRFVGALVLVLAFAVGARADAYAELLAKLKAGDTKIDYAALRYAYAESPTYDGYGAGPPGAHKAMGEAFRAGNCKEALTQSKLILDSIYIDIPAHAVASRCYAETYDVGTSNFHRAIATGLERSILASGDGKSPATAYVVVRVSEEYHVIAALGFRPGKQSLVHSGGSSYDLMQVTDASGEEVSIYFQIDRVLAGLTKRLEVMGLSPK